jgi:hypothetical protein
MSAHSEAGKEYKSRVAAAICHSTREELKNRHLSRSKRSEILK